MLRVVFMGTPDFGVPALHALAARHDVVAVYTRPDSVSGRGSKTHPSPVKLAAAELGLAVRQPTTLRDPAVQAEMAALDADVIVVVAYGLILPREVLEIPALGCINVHASLLPRWRGAAPIQRAILAGDSATGVSIMRMEEGLDTGPFCATARVEIAGKYASALTEELAQAGAATLVSALESIENETCVWQEQDDSAATYADKVGKADVALMPNLTVEEAMRRVRASSPQAPARAAIADRGVTIVEASPADCAVGEGRVEVTKSSVFLGFSDGSLSVLRLRPDGRTDMSGADWARGLQASELLEWTAA